MSDQYLVITTALSWGKGRTEKEALANAHSNSYCGRKEYGLIIYRFPPELIDDFYCDAMGAVCWEWKEGIDDDTQCLLRDTLRVGAFKRSKSGKLKEIEG